RCVDLNKRKGMVSLTTNSNIKLVPEKINFSDFNEGLFKGHFVSLEIGEIEIVPELNIGVSCEKEVNLIKYYPGITEAKMLIVSNSIIDFSEIIFPDEMVKVIDIKDGLLNPILPTSADFEQGPLARVYAKQLHTGNKGVRIKLYFKNPVILELNKDNNICYVNMKSPSPDLSFVKEEQKKEVKEEPKKRIVDLEVRFQYIDHLIRFQRYDKALAEVNYILSIEPEEKRAKEYLRRVKNLIFLSE
ncbi:MAG: hypothetical protein AB1765_10905, partial [Candidatus Hydrogenedentota bacterium]